MDVEKHVQEEVILNTNDKKKTQNPPPIILHRKPSLHKNLIAYLKSRAKDKFAVKYRNEFTTIYLDDMHDRI